MILWYFKGGIEHETTTQGEHGKGQTAALLANARDTIKVDQSCTAVLGSQIFDTARLGGTLFYIYIYIYLSLTLIYTEQHTLWH